MAHLQTGLRDESKEAHHIYRALRVEFYDKVAP